MLRDRTARLWALAIGAFALALVGAGVWLAHSDSGGRDQFTDRPVLQDCGRTRVGLGDTVGRAVTDVGREANECFDAAVAEGTGAELGLEATSVEGEPVFEYYRALPEGGVEVFVDYRGGGFGDPSLTWFRCPDVRTYLVAPNGCEDREL